MIKITESYVISSGSPAALNENINRMIKDGFEPQGGVSTTSIEATHHHRNYETYSVLMVKKVEAK